MTDAGVSLSLVLEGRWKGEGVGEEGGEYQMKYTHATHDSGYKVEGKKHESSVLKDVNQ
jgi:hypothetical protein